MTRTFILTTGAVFALVVPAAHAAPSKNAFQARLQPLLVHGHQAIGKGHASNGSTSIAAPKRQGQVRQAVLPTAEPAAPGTGIPIQATTTDDYDNPQVIYGKPTPVIAPFLVGSSSDAPQSPLLIDGYLLQ